MTGNVVVAGVRDQVVRNDVNRAVRDHGSGGGSGDDQCDERAGNDGHWCAHSGPLPSPPREKLMVEEAGCKKRPEPLTDKHSHQSDKAEERGRGRRQSHQAKDNPDGKAGTECEQQGPNGNHPGHCCRNGSHSARNAAGNSRCGICPQSRITTRLVLGISRGFCGKFGEVPKPGDFGRLRVVAERHGTIFGSS